MALVAAAAGRVGAAQLVARVQLVVALVVALVQLVVKLVQLAAAISH